MVGIFDYLSAGPSSIAHSKVVGRVICDGRILANHRWRGSVTSNQSLTRALQPGFFISYSVHYNRIYCAIARMCKLLICA